MVDSIFSQVCYVQMSLSEFDKLTVELVPEKLMIPDTIELPQYHVEESIMRLEYRTEGKN